MSGSSRTRKTLLALSLAAACASAVPASAATITVLNRSLPPEAKVLGTELEVDEKAGRVRIAVDVYDDSWDGYLTSESVAVPGLTFDRERREVLYESGGSVVTCARPKKFLWSTSYPVTGACRIIVRTGAPTADAGPGEPAPRNWVVELATEEPTKAAMSSVPRPNP